VTDKNLTNFINPNLEFLNLRGNEYALERDTRREGKEREYCRGRGRMEGERKRWRGERRERQRY
jgi:hypothetical protein